MGGSPSKGPHRSGPDQSGSGPQKTAKGGGLRVAPVLRQVDARGLTAAHGQGVFVRVFVPAHTYPIPDIARMVREAEAGAREAGARQVRAVVFGGGTGCLDGDFETEGDWWDDGSREKAQDAAFGWAAQFSEALGGGPPRVVLGLDGAVRFPAGGWRYPQGIQLAVRVEPGRGPHVTWKSVPIGSDERDSLCISWDDVTDLPAADAVERNHAIGQFDEGQALFLICHDVTAFGAPRGFYRHSPRRWPVVVRAQYRSLIERHHPLVGFSLVHTLPSYNAPSGGLPTIFTSSQSNLSEGWHPLSDGGHKEFPPVPVVSVARYKPGIPGPLIDTIRARMVCTLPHVDVVFGRA